MKRQMEEEIETKYLEKNVSQERDKQKSDKQEKYQQEPDKKRQRIENIADRKENAMCVHYINMYTVNNPKDNWFATKFHGKLYRKYINHMFQYDNGKGEMENMPKEKKLDFIKLIRETLNEKKDIVVTQMSQQTGVCDFCGKYKTITREIKFGDNAYYLGRNCCTNMMKIVDFYKEMRQLIKTKEKFFKIDMDNILKYLNETKIC
jgi:hypothetical protein